MNYQFESQRVYRSHTHKKISGVCAGIASYWKQPAWAIRLAAIGCLIVLPMTTAIAYLLAVLLIPSRY